jgi:ATP citrate (pro-S)-lyase
MVAGGGASVIYADTISDLGYGEELANYGEYSGSPSEFETYSYGKTILSLMTKGEPRDDGKILIIVNLFFNYLGWKCSKCKTFI